MKKLEDDFNTKLYYKKFMNKFELPIIKDKVPKIIKRKLDLSPYNRVNKYYFIIKYNNLYNSSNV